MRLPELQAELRALAEDMDRARFYQWAKALRQIAADMTRRSPKSRAPIKSERMTPDLRRKIRDYCKVVTTASQKEVAEIFNVNPGRVSEALRGKRK